VSRMSGIPYTQLQQLPERVFAVLVDELHRG
jgi:hypothetical protein